jgi:hypothetical protein
MPKGVPREPPDAIREPAAECTDQCARDGHGEVQGRDDQDDAHDAQGVPERTEERGPRSGLHSHRIIYRLYTGAI